MVKQEKLKNMRKLATIQRITALNPIPNADAIELASILGWKVVVKKGEFHVGSLVVYFEIDSLMPQRPEFEFLKNSNYRIRTLRLRGQISQGIAFPLDILPIEVKWHVEELERSRITLHDLADSPIGFDVTEELGIEKYEAPIPAELAGDAKGALPSFFQVTDEDRIQILPHIPEQHAGKPFIATEKLDGCLDGDTLIETEEGVKTIKEICETKYLGKVKTFDFKNNKISFEKIISHSIKKNNDLIKTRETSNLKPKKWFKITLENDEILILTENHEIWIPKLGCWRRTDSLIGDEEFLIDN